jgi:hypothetical protein
MPPPIGCAATADSLFLDAAVPGLGPDELTHKDISDRRGDGPQFLGEVRQAGYDGGQPEVVTRMYEDQRQLNTKR